MRTPVMLARLTVSLAAMASLAMLAPAEAPAPVSAPAVTSPNTTDPGGGGNGHVSGCRTGRVYKYVWNPHKDTTYRGALDELLLQREVGIYHGWYCRKPGRDKVKFKFVEACWTWILGPEAGVFTGNRQHFAMYVASAVGANINISNFTISPDKHKDKQQCRRRDVPMELEAWQYIHKTDGRQNLFVRFGGSIQRRFGFHDVPYTSGARGITQKNGILIGRL